jgi:hypothetical protein
MCLFSSKSKSATTNNNVQTTTNTQTTSNTQIDNSRTLDGVEGHVIDAGGSVSIISTDQGAIEAGRRIGEAALDTVGETSIHAIDALTAANDRSLDFGDAVVEMGFSFAGDALKTQAETTASGFGTLAGAIDKAAQATRSDSADTLQKIAKWGGIAIAAIAVGAIIIASMKGK